jgi:two-component system cell cycle sensor histidine kinase/response regulator CckA
LMEMKEEYGNGMAENSEKAGDSTRIEAEELTTIYRLLQGEDERGTESILTLKEERDLYRAMAEYSQDLENWIDPEGKLRWVNVAGELHTGYTRQECLAMENYPLPLIFEDDRERMRAELAEARKGFARTDVEFRLVRKNGDIVWVSASWRPFYGRDEAFLGLRVSIRDISSRKAAEELLKAERLRFLNLIEEAPIGVALIDRDLKFTYVNPKYTEVFGYTIEEIGDKGEWVNRAYPDPAYRKEVIKAWKEDAGRFEPGEKAARIFKAVCRDGSEKTARFITVVLEAGDYLFTCEDITEKERANDLLKEQFTFLQTLIDAVPNPIFYKNREGQFLGCNRAYEAYHGISRSELVGKTVYDVLPEDLARLHEEKDQEVLRELKPQVYESLVPERDGSARNVIITKATFCREDGGVAGLIGVIVDIEDRKQFEKQLKESEERYRIAIEHSNDGIGVLKGDIPIYVNQRFTQIFGYSGTDEILGKPISVLIHPDDVDRVMEVNRLRQLGMEVPSRYEAKGLKKDGDPVYIEVSATQTTYSGETVSLIYVRDVTERKNLEAQLHQAQKMEAVGQLAGGVAHDFNNILTAIMGYANLLQMKISGDDPLRTYVDQVVSASQNAAQITQDLLVFSRKQTFELKAQKMGRLLVGMEKLLLRLLREDIDLKISIGEPDLAVMIDANRINQVLINLATNARDAMSGGGTLSIGVQSMEMDNVFVRTHGYGEVGRYVVVHVSDTGTGMDAKTIQRIFDPFFTTKQAGRGTGLGLSIVYSIVKQHGGYVTVYSEVGQGTTFRVYLPVVNEAEEDVSEVTPEIAGGTETIMIVEDNSDVRNLAVTILSEYGYRIIEARDGAEAVERFAEQAEEIELVILDVVMPKKNGKEALEEILAVKPGVSALFISGYTADILFDKGLRDSSVDFIAKPIAPRDLLGKVREILDRKGSRGKSG